MFNIIYYLIEYCAHRGIVEQSYGKEKGDIQINFHGTHKASPTQTIHNIFV